MAIPAASTLRLRLFAVVMPALLAGGFEFGRHSLHWFDFLPEDAGNFMTAGMALLGGLFYFHTVYALVTRLVRENEVVRAERELAVRRQGLAESLHDRVLQALFFLNITLQRARRHADGGERAAAVQDVDAALAAVAGTYEAVRQTIRELQADGPAGGAPPASLGEVVAQALGGADLTWHVEGSEHWLAASTAERAALNAIVAEAVRNANKHAEAQTLRVVVKPERVVVADDGRGFRPQASGVGCGLQLMAQRAAAMDWRLHIDSELGRGTCVVVERGETSQATGGEAK